MPDEATPQVETRKGDDAALELIARLCESMSLTRANGAPELAVEMRRVGDTTTFRFAGRAVVFSPGKFEVTRDQKPNA